MRPESFDVEHQEQWSRWVLEHGVPDLGGRSSVAVGEAVPVSWWTGPDTAAVLHVRVPPAEWRGDDEEDPFAEVDVECFVRAGQDWESAGGGGSGPVPEPALVAVPVPPRTVLLDGQVGSSTVTALYGDLGAEAATIEVRQAGDVTRHPVVAPTGLQVVSARATEAFAVRVLDPRGGVLAEIERPAGWDE